METPTAAANPAQEVLVPSVDLELTKEVETAHSKKMNMRVGLELTKEKNSKKTNCSLANA